MHKNGLLTVSTGRIIIAITSITAMMVFYVVFQHINKQYEQAKIAGKNDLYSLTRVVSSNLEQSFSSIDQTLQRAAERQYFNMLFGKTLRADMEHNLALWVNETPHIETMFFTDEKGVVDVLFKKGESEFRVLPGYKFSSDKHFKAHKNAEDIDLFMSRPDGGSRVFISRRIVAINGGFGGLVVAVVDTDYIEELVYSLDKKRRTQMFVLLGDSDFIVNAREGNGNLFKSFIGEFKREYHEDANVFEKYVDNEFAIFSFDKLKVVPISFSLVMMEDAVFAGLVSSNKYYIVFLSIFSALTGLIIFLAYSMERKIAAIKKSERKAFLSGKVKSDFLRRAGHDLRTPLNAIIGFSDMLISGYFGKVNPDQTERLKDVSLCGNHLLEITEDITDFSQADSGKLRISEKNIHIYDLVVKVFKILEQKAIASDVLLINKVLPDVNYIYADGRRIKQMLMNLLSDSIRFTPAGGSARVSTGFDNKDNFLIEVKDTGVGIVRKNLLEEVSDPDRKSGSRATSGGIGLPFCRMLAQMHGGTLRVSSSSSRGRRVVITLPADRVRKEVVKEVLEVA